MSADVFPTSPSSSRDQDPPNRPTSGRQALRPSISTRPVGAAQNATRRLGLPILILLATLALATPASAAEPFGVETFETTIEDQNHAPATQAGSHPSALTTTIIFNHQLTGEKESFRENLNEEEVPLEEPDLFARIAGNPKHLELNLPAGLIVNPAASSLKCTEAQLETNPSAGGSCPAASAVGTLTVYISGLGAKIKAAVYNMSPPPGVPAELGVDPGELGVVLHLVGHIRTGGDYGFSAEVSEIAQTASIYGLGSTLWGDASAPEHDAQRGTCAASGRVAKAIEEEFWENENRTKGKSTRQYRFNCPVQRTSTPLLSMPVLCTGRPLQTTLSVDSWQQPENLEPAPALSPPLTGCEHLDFSPSLNAQPVPEPPAAESPTGLSLDLELPHEQSTEALVPADLKQLTVTLPLGMAISPSAAGGLGVCTDAPEPGRPEGQIALHSTEPARCPEASKLGTAEVLTPLLQTPLQGAVYLAQPNAFQGSLVGLYLVLEGSGVTLKLPGKATLDSATGQVAISFQGLPQLPLAQLRLSIFSGPRAALLTPPACGSYEIHAALQSSSGDQPVLTSSSFQVPTGPHGEPCPSGRFAPSFAAGMASNQAAAFSPFSLTLARRDGEQRFAAVTVRMPPGLLGDLRNVALCPEPQASTGICPQASQIGTITVGAGPDPDQLFLPQQGQEPNAMYLTGPYDGAPFGLTVLVPAIAGPFDLGQIVTRAKLEVDPRTAQLTATTDSTVAGIPSIKDGIPLDIRTIAVNVDRDDFMFNPTRCTPQAVAGTIASAPATSATGSSSSSVSSPFQAADCAALRFAPKLSALTHARATKAAGSYLHVKVLSGAGQANIEKLKVDLPKQLPARLSTLQRACPVRTFQANYAACPPASVVGAATASTPLLVHPLTGPTYLVSHGNAAFPDLEIVLQGEGILLVLDGQTSIEHGIVSATFKTIPDAPITSFDLVLPSGPHSLLAANFGLSTQPRLCSQTLHMPTAITAQNGAVVKQSTDIAISGCPERKRPKPQAHRTRG